MGMFLRKIPRPSNERDRAPSVRELGFILVYALSMPGVVAFLIHFSPDHALTKGAIKYGVMPWAFGFPLIVVDTCLRAMIHRYPQQEIWKKMWDQRALIMLVVFGLIIILLFIAINQLEARYTLSSL